MYLVTNITSLDIFCWYLFVLDADDGVVKRRDAARKKDSRKVA